MKHALPHELLERQVRVDLAGCGGNGSQMLTGLARLHHALTALGHPGFSVNAWDPDEVSEANVARQLFSPADVGLNKATILVHRLNAWFGLRWSAWPGNMPCRGRRTTRRTS
jgi:PRTRC genetic system ThiF family protein